jgi:phosphomannomutase
MKALVVFDLDGTLAESKSSIDAEMAMLLDRLLGIVKVAVISGGAWQQFEQQLLARLAQGESLNNLSLLPTSGTKFYQYKIGWTALYSEDFSEAERTKIKESLKRATESSRREVGKGWGETIEDRGSQITYSALGQQAPLDEKRRWDPDFTRRMKIKAVLDTLIPEFSVTLGGATSIDVTKHGVDKAYGIGKLRDILHIPIDQMIFIGDAVFPGGNDYPAKQAGALTIEVRDPHETKRVIEAIIACLADNRSVDFSYRPFAICWAPRDLWQAVSSAAARNGRCSRWESVQDSPGARVRLPRSRPPGATSVTTLPGPQPGCIDVGNGVFGDALLFRAGVEDCRSITLPGVIALAIARARVVNLEKEFENLAISSVSQGRR